MPSSPARAAVDGGGFVWLSRRGVPGWPLRNDNNYARTMPQAISTDGRWVLLSAGSASGGLGADWSAVFLKDTVSGTTTLVTTDVNGTPFPGTTGNLNAMISPHGAWLVWQHYATNPASSTLYARDLSSGTVYLMPGAPNVGPRTITDNGVVYANADTTNMPGGSPYLRSVRWDVTAGTVVPVTDPAQRPQTFVTFNTISGDGRTLFLDTSGELHAIDLVTGTVSLLPYTPRTGTHWGLMSVARSGRFVLIWADDPALSPAATTATQVYLLDRQTGALDWVSAPSPGGSVDPSYSYSAEWRAVSDDGRYAIFGGGPTRQDIPPLDPQHVGERSTYFAGVTFIRDRVAGTTRLVVPTYTYNPAIDARVVAFDTLNSYDPTDPGDIDAYLSGRADTLAPIVTGTPDRPPNANGWYNAPITISWSSTDPAPSSGTPTTPPATVAASEGRDQVFTSGPSCDPAGNCATGRYTLSMDRTPPTITQATTPSPNNAGWSNQDVTVTFICSDAPSGIATCPGPATVSADTAGQTLTGTALDNAGNTASTSTTVKVDQTPPLITASLAQAANGNGWNNADVVVTFACADALSGIQSCPQPVTLTEDGADQVVTGTVVDRAGNTATATVTVSIDRTRPLITAARTPANGNGWNNGPVTVTFTCADAISGIATCPNPTTVTAEGADQRVAGTAVNHAGTTATAEIAAINIDTTPPGITATIIGTKNSAGWYRTPPVVHFTCTDTLSGIDTCPADIRLITDGANQYVIGTATDKAGNSTDATATGLNVDLTAPVVNIVGATNGATYPLDQIPTITCATNDATSGVATQATAATTRTPSGVYTARCSGASDLAGNTATTVVITYTVTPTTNSLIELTRRYVSSSGSPNANGVIQDLTNKLLHGQICQYITKVNRETSEPNPTLTTVQAAELGYWARILDPSC